MNENELRSNSKKNYKQLHRILKSKCEDISKENEALNSRLLNIKLLIYKAESQCRKVQNRLECHGVDYQAAAIAASIAEETNNELMNTKKVCLKFFKFCNNNLC